MLSVACEEKTLAGTSVRGSPGQLLLGTQTLHAEIDPLRLTPDSQSCGMDIGLPTSVGVPFGVANVVTGLRYLAADIALCHRL